MIERLLVRLIGDGSSYQAMITGAVAQTNAFQKSINRVGANISRMGRNITRMGRNLTFAVTLPLVGMGAAAVNEFAKFDSAMTQSTAIMSVTADQTERMKELALGLSQEAIQGPAELAEAYFFLASAGLDAEAAMQALPAVARFATAGMFNMSEATDLLTDAQSALGMTIRDDPIKNLENMIELSDLLVGANTLANASVQQFSTALTSKAAAAFKAYNIQTEDGIALLAAFADQGIKAELAGNATARLLRLMTKAARDNAEEFDKLGIALFDEGEFRPMAQIIGDIQGALKDLTTEEKAAALESLGFQARVQDVILPLLGAEKAIGMYHDRLLDMGGLTEQVANKQLASFSSQLKIMRNQATVLAIELGEALAPTILALNRIVLNLTEEFRSWDESTRTIVATVLVALAVLGPLLVVLGFIVQAVGALVTALSAVISVLVAVIGGIGILIGLVVGGIIALRVWTGSWEEVGRIVMNVANTIVNSIIFALRVIGRATTALVGWLVIKFENFWSFQWIGMIKQAIGKAALMLIDFFEWVVDKVVALFTGTETGSIQDFLGQFTGDLARGAESGDILATMRDIAGEEMAHFRTRQAADIVAGDRGDPIQTKEVEGSDKGQKTMEEVARGIREMTGLLEQEVEKQAVELQPLGLR